ncbi:MAG: hypothetical protein GF307_01125 [candidate division Zixibacteria bacterium]|nr:hypothetical protein [candidate division Zixibacteria bacterium]
MKRIIIAAMALLMLLPASGFAYESLQAVFDSAGSAFGYDKYIVLDPRVEYEGDLQIYSGDKVRIIGNGAKIYGQQYNNSIYVYYSLLDVSDCIFIGGQRCLYYEINSQGKVFNNTLIGADSAGIQTYYPNSNYDVEIYDNIIYDCYFGIAAAEDYLPAYIGYNIINNSGWYNYAQYCYG